MAGGVIEASQNIVTDLIYGIPFVGVYSTDKFLFFPTRSSVGGAVWPNCVTVLRRGALFFTKLSAFIFPLPASALTVSQPTPARASHTS